jgi:hypothetical protein
MGQAHFDRGTGTELAKLATKVAFDPRADDGRRVILLGRRTVTIRRRLRGVKMHLSVPVETYLGVVMAREGQPDGVLYRVTLAHRDPDLSVTLKESRSRTAMIEAWHQWSAYFAAPSDVEHLVGATSPAEPGHMLRMRRTKVRTACGRRANLGDKPRRGARVSSVNRGGRPVTPKPRA